VQGIVEVLKVRATDPALFQMFSGTSVGSINTCFLCANAHRGDMGIFKLRELWESLDVNVHLKLRTRSANLGLAGLLRGEWFSKALLDARPLELLVRRNLSFDDLHRNIQNGTVAAAMVAAFNVATSQTTIFTELGPNTSTRPSRDPSRREILGRILPGHILASSAMPYLFPAREIAGNYYCDGGLRFNTPVSPAIRAGAGKLVVVTLSTHTAEEDLRKQLTDYPTVPFLFGRLLKALLLDPVDYDLEVLERFNRLTSALEHALPPDQLDQVLDVMRQTRGAPYRKLQTLVFSPSEDLGKLAHEHLRVALPKYKLGRIPRYFLKRASADESIWEAGWAAYLLFDGGYARDLMDLGYRDAHLQADAIREFFADRAGAENANRR
jgi:NTE family protein